MRVSNGISPSCSNLNFPATGHLIETGSRSEIYMIKLKSNFKQVLLTDHDVILPLNCSR